MTLLIVYNLQNMRDTYLYIHVKLGEKKRFKSKFVGSNL